MALKGIKPEVVVPSKPKIMLSGIAGTGKSIFSLNAPAPFYIDTESGATREQYMQKLIASKGVYFGPQQGSQDFAEITEQVKELATTKHEFKTIVVDSLTKPYRMEQHAAEDRGVSAEFKKSQREAERPARKLLSWLLRPDLDLTVIMICHSKYKWTKIDGQLVNEGTVWEGPEKLDHELDLWFETTVVGGNWYGTVKKSRVDSFKLGTSFPLDFNTFKTMYGATVVDLPIKPIVLATEEQVSKIKHLIDILKVPVEDIDKWLMKAQATEIADLNQDNANKLFELLNKKIKGETK